jgi:hypothetical protein
MAYGAIVGMWGVGLGLWRCDSVLSVVGDVIVYC